MSKIESKENKITQVKEHKSYFFADPINYTLLKVACWFLNLISLTLLVPITLHWLYVYEAKYTLIDDERLVYKENIGHAYLRYLSYVGLIVITLGIYSWFIKGREIKAHARHTAFLRKNISLDGSYMKIDLFNYGIVSINAFIWKYITLGFGRPTSETMKTRVRINNSRINGVKLVYTASSGAAYLRYCVAGLLSMYSLGFFGLLVSYPISSFDICHSIVDENNILYTNKKSIIERFTLFCIKHRIAYYIIFISLCLVALGLVLWL